MPKRPYQDGEVRRRDNRAKDEARAFAVSAVQSALADDIAPLLNTRLPIPSPKAIIGHSQSATGVLVVGLFSLVNVTILNDWQTKFNAHVTRFNALVDALKEAGVIE